MSLLSISKTTNSNAFGIPMKTFKIIPSLATLISLIYFSS
jgi:hypothetical protein